MNGSTVTVKITADSSGLDKGLDSAESKVSEFEGKAKKSFNGMSTEAKIAFAAVVAAGTFAFGKLLSAASDLESLRASFESLTGSIDDTNNVMNTLYQYGKQTAFDNASIQQSARMFLANGVAVKDLMGWMKNLGDVAGSTGADLTGLALPITQAIGAGKMMTQDWYQIINQGAGGLQKYIIAALGAGHSTKTFKDDLADGAVTAEILQKALALASSEGGMAFQGAIKQANTFNGRMSNAKEAITQFGLGLIGVNAATGEIKAGGIFDTVSKSVQGATEFITKHKVALTAVLMFVSILLIPAFVSLGVSALVAGAQMLAGWLMALGPIGLIVAGITALVATFIYLWDNVEGFRNFFISAWSGIVGFFGGVTAWIGQKTSDIINFFGQIPKKVSDFFNSIPDKISGVVDKITGFFSGIGKKIGDFIAGGFKSVINGGLKLAEDFLNAPINLINGAIDLINKIPGVDIGKISKISLPRMAKGYLADSPTVGIFGEAGREAVMPLERNTGWIDDLAADIQKRGGVEGGSGGTVQQTNYNYTNYDVDVANRDLARMMRRAAV